MSTLSLALTMTLLAADKPRVDIHGDPLPKGAIARVGSTRLRHTQMVIGLSFAPDGKTFATSGWDNLVRLWDAKTGREIRQFQGHKNPVYGVAFSRDGKLLVSNGQEQTIRVWEVATGKQVRELSGHGSQHSRFVFTTDNKYLISGGENSVAILWDHNTGKEVRRFEGHKSKVSAVDVSPDGKVLATGSSDTNVKLWTIATGKEILTMGPLDGQIASVRFSPDGKTLAVGSYGGNIYLFDPKDGKQIRTMRGHSSSTWPVAWSHDGKLLATGGSDGLVLIWDPANGMQKHKLVGHTQGVPKVAFSPDGSTLVSVGHDNAIRLWDPKSGRELLQSTRHAGLVKVIALSPDGKLLATSGTEKVVHLWEASTGRPVGSLGNHSETVYGLAFTPDSKHLVTTSGSQELLLWDAATCKEVERTILQAQSLSPPIVSPDGKTVAAVLDGRKLLMWDIPTLKVNKTIEGHLRGINQLAWSIDGRTIAAGGSDGIGIFDVSAGRWLARSDGGGTPVIRMEFTADARLLLVRWSDGSFAIIETATGGRRLGLDGLLNKPVLFSLLPGERLLTTGGDALICLRNLRGGKVLAEMTGPDKSATCQTASRDGKLLVTGSQDTTALVWDVTELAKFKAPEKLMLTAPNPEHAWLTLAGDADRADNTIERLVANPSAALELFRERLKTEAPVDGKKVAALIKQLDDKRFAKRESAMRELEALGAMAEAAIKKALAENPSLDLRRRLEALKERLGKIVVQPEQARAMRAVEILERIGDNESRKLLTDLANAAVESRVSLEAKTALGRLSKR